MELGAKLLVTMRLWIVKGPHDSCIKNIEGLENRKLLYMQTNMVTILCVTMRKNNYSG